MKITAMAVFLMCIPLAAEEPRGAAGKRAEPSTVADKEGKKKVVVETPFGPSLREAPAGGGEAGKSRAREVKDDALLEIDERGDTIRFRRRTPFGEQVWERKRSELTAAEQEMMAARRKTREKEAAKAPRPAAGGERTP